MQTSGLGFLRAPANPPCMISRMPTRFEHERGGRRFNFAALEFALAAVGIVLFLVGGAP